MVFVQKCMTVTMLHKTGKKVKVRGLTRRRADEMKLFRTPWN
jgi:GH24 family phage-related lysozyme (muramidase)